MNFCAIPKVVSLNTPIALTHLLPLFMALTEGLILLLLRTQIFALAQTHTDTHFRNLRNVKNYLADNMMDEVSDRLPWLQYEIIHIVAQKKKSVKDIKNRKKKCYASNVRQ